jgi:hypothetical protein
VNWIRQGYNDVPGWSLPSTWLRDLPTCVAVARPPPSSRARSCVSARASHIRVALALSLSLSRSSGHLDVTYTSTGPGCKSVPSEREALVGRVLLATNQLPAEWARPAAAR